MPNSLLNVLSVTALTNQIRSVLESDFVNISVQGEISNYKHHSSGHKYFTIKDDKAQLKSVMWKSRSLNFPLKDGMKVIATGSITLYPPQGSYQLDCYSLKPMGEGDLFMAYEALKAKLLQAGYFDENRKKMLPKIPLNIGISTSPTGAAFQDMISTLKRRLPFAKIYFRPTLVQGEGSAEDIVNAIEELELSPAELIIIGRGGGSIEDLWSYNTEIVADAIYNCKKPLISAVGHETDFTIADFVADLRSPTPTAAAELAGKITIDDLNNFFDDSKIRMKRNISAKLDLYKTSVLERFAKFAGRRVIDNINKYNQFNDYSESFLVSTINSDIEKKSADLKRLESHLKSLHPLSPLDKGFAALKSAGKYIHKEISLLEFKEIELIRKNDVTKVKILEG
jgi:exodeoxyribonuclease VII large subunit